MTTYEFFLASSLEKVFPHQRPAALDSPPKLTVIRGQVPAVQLVYRKRSDTPAHGHSQPFSVSATGAPFQARLRTVELIPSDFPAYEVTDSHYLTTQPGLFPDLLRPLKQNTLTPLLDQYRAVWIDFPDTKDAAPGTYTVTLALDALEKSAIPNGTIAVFEDAARHSTALTLTLEVLAAQLPPQTLLHTEWFHADCLADYYRVPAFSEEHWRIVENYIAMAAGELGINMLLTPVFTPPLDTAVGGERTTVQLVDITLENGQYRFDFDKLARWCTLCKRHCVANLEIAHLFTQWGAAATPKIIATADGQQKRIFGWDVPATSPAYREFLRVFIPALRHALEGMGFDRGHVYFHISDEPHAKHLESYQAAKAMVAGLLEGCPVIDALSDYDYYEKGLVQLPIPSNDHIQPFIDHNVPDLWVYYCCAQCKDVPNRFFAMPSARNRIMGVLMYLYNIRGFLHWGYNFYHAQFSLEAIDPYFNTHAGYAFPSGDPFLVYPGPDGAPLSSIRAQVQREALDDLAALRLLESLAGRERVETLIYQGVDKKITFSRYPAQADYLLELHEKVTAEIAKHIR